jgi:hypothetical protein
VVEEIFKGRAKQVNDEYVVEPLLSKVVDIWDPGWKNGEP